MASGPEARNLVVLCDGTGNQVEDNLSNVLKLYRIAQKDESQLVYYHPGLGTIGLQSSWGRLVQDAGAVLGLATGWGLDRDILDAYDFLARTYRPGDRLFLFGFSRGAYTARALAGMIHLMGLLRPEQINLSGAALTAYKRASAENSLPIAWQFRRVIDGRRVPIHFIGAWDSVASILVPRPDRFYIPTMQFLPYTKTNPSVRSFRQAVSIDERRRMFRPYGWKADQLFKPDPFDEAGALPQDQADVWFAGCHSDVGGGFAEAESRPAKSPLIWLAREAEAKGLKLDQAMFDHLACGAPIEGGREHYVGPDPTAPLHDSMAGLWRILEWLPKNLKWRRWPSRTTARGWYLPRSEPRFIDEGAALHRSVIDRIAKTSYGPVNLPKTYAAADDLSPAGR